MKDIIIAIIKDAISACKDKGLLTVAEFPSIILEKPKREGFGDFATNAAMLIASKEGKQPRKVAELIVKEISDKTGIIKKLDIAGPGFINILIDKNCWERVLKDIETAGNKYGHTDIGKDRKVLIEFVSANPTGPLHIGHARGAAVGDTLANILKASGYDVTKEYYINDRGVQVYTLGNSVRFRYLELHGKEVEPPQDYYKGEYVKDIARDFAAKYGSNVDVESTEVIISFVDFAKDALLAQIQKDLEDFGVKFDKDEWFSEKEKLYDASSMPVLQALDKLEEKGVTFLEDDAMWFRTMDFGDDKNRVLIKKDREFTYFASDVAYHLNKIERGFDTIINVWGADHHGYEARIRAIFKALGYDDKMLKIVFIQLVTLLRNGAPVPMGKREGEFVTLRQVIDEVGKDACRFFFLMRKSDAHLDFDLELAKKQAPENPVFYVQYAHARISSIIKHAKENGISIPAYEEIDLSLLNQDEELAIIKTLASFPDIIKGCATSLEPHRLTFYLQELAGIFHPYYNKNRVVTDNIELSKARLFLCNAVKIVIKNGLALLNVSAPEEM
ncbi:MAG: arginine--tRNA ligase [Deltaproteobacteria bacterium]|nr:arginine--tRNA ligase [Deltaproteobacteria bacterium]